MLDRILIGSSAEPTDPNFKNVTLLLHGDGSNGAQNNTFLDSSTNNFTITRNGNTTQGSFSPYGSNWSNYFDGSGDFLSVASNAAFDLGSSDFTVECWFNSNSFAAGFGLISRYNYTSVGLGWSLSVTSSTNVRFVRGNDIILDCTVSAMSIGTWYHVAVVRNGSTLTVYLNGVQVGQTTGISNFTDAATALQIGRTNTATNDINGYISNARVLKGTALYTSTFTPSTTPLTAITNTSLLTCQSNRFIDNSANNFTITRNGDVKVTNFAPFAPSAAYSTTTNGGSAYFDGTGDYLTASSNAAFGVGTGDFTIEAWIFPTGAWASGGFNCLLQIDGTGIYFGQNSAGFGLRQSGVANIISYGTSPTLNTWTHVAIVRSGTTVTMYYNGTSVATATSSANFGTGGAWIGADAGPGSYYAGYISNLRLLKGTAVYTSNFTPPSSPVTAITNTSLLTNFTNAAIFDNSMKNDLETVGNAQISTSVKKFGTGSIYFDGSGDYLITPKTQELDLSSGNWTIEGWFYPNNSSTNMVFAMVGNTNSDKIVLATLSPNGYISYLLNGGVVISTTSAVANNAWSHFALVKNGSTTTLYLNGTSTGTTTSVPTSSAKLFAAGRDAIGGGAEVNGYIDDIRITNGVARYTANFTPPTAAFPNK